jgi:hypothetical protein
MGVLSVARHGAGRLLAGLSLLSLAAGPVMGQSSELYTQGEYLIDGIQPACGDVETLVTDEGPELIYARDYLTIVINGPVFDALPTEAKLFAYYETCGMMAFAIRDDAAQLADAVTTRRGLADGWMTAAVAEAICETDMMAVAGWTAAPDADRCAAIYEIMREALR